MAHYTPSKRKGAAWTFLAAVIVASAAWSAELFASLDQAFVDMQTRLLQYEVASDIVIVEIDAHSLKSLGQWPLPRSKHGELVRRLDAAGVRGIFLDIDFSVASTLSEDEQLASALAGLRAPLVLPAFWQPTSEGASSLVLSEPIPALRRHATLGLVNLVPGSDGLVRDVQSLADLSGETSPVWSAFDNHPRRTEATLTLDYRIAPSSFTRFSYADIVSGTAPASLNGKIVFVGATAIELGDTVAVPVHRALPGVVVQAIAYESVRVQAIATTAALPLLAMLIPWCALCVWIVLRSRWRRSPLIALALISTAPIVTATCYAFNLLVPVTPFIVSAIVVLTGSLLSSLSTESWRAWSAQRRTHEQNALLRQVVTHSAEAILTLDDRGIVRTANPAAATILGVSTHRLLGAPLTDVAPPIADIVYSSSGAEGPQEITMRREDGSDICIELNTASLKWELQRITTVALRDVTAQKSREQELRHLALHDALTKLPNRVYLRERLNAALLERTPNQRIALMMLDLDGFKEVNDTLGHSMGDALMVELGTRLAQLANRQRHIARVGGDEFALVLTVDHMPDIEELAQELLLLVQEPILIQGIPVSLGTSIGIALCPDHADNAESLLKQADVALYVAKRKKTRVEFYEPSADTNSPRRLEMLTLLRTAAAKGELTLHYQPKITMRSGAVQEVEALCRWESPVLGRVSPGEFIPLAEASEVIKPLTEWTIRQAMVDCRAWHDAGLELKVAVNLSARHLQDAKLPRWLEATFNQTRTQASWLELEITESAIMMDPDRAAKVLHALHELGVLLSIDDFGTGYSSLSYLRELSVDRLKIDRSFIADIEQGQKNQFIVESTIKLAHGLGLQAVAEGVENERQYQLLRGLGCDVAQGFLIAKPMPSAQLLEWKRAHDGDSGKLIAREQVHSVPLRYATKS